MIQGPSPQGQGPCSIRLQFMENIQTRFLDMKLFKFSVAALLALATAFLGGCSDDDGIDNRDRDYGYVQFKLHKEASYDAVSRAQKPQLDYLSEASKVQVSLYYDGTTITQSLALSAPDKESAEFGLRSEKLRLLAGQYQLITFSLFNADDELIYNGMPGEERLDIVAGGLVSHDLTVDVEPRGTVRFSISKDLSDFTETPVVTRAAERQYTFDEIAFLDLTVKHKTTNELTTFEKLSAKFSIHFKDDREDGAPRGHRGRLPDLLARMRHAALAQSGRLSAWRDTRPTTRIKSCWRPISAPRTWISPSRTTRPPKAKVGVTLLRGRRVHPRLLRALRNLEGARRGALVLQGRELCHRRQLGFQ